MKYFIWDNEKNELLKAERGISFEETIFYIQKGHLLDIVEHPNQKKYQGQKLFIIEIDNYAYLIPFIELEKEIVLKTIIPSRKATKKYLSGKKL